MIYVWYGILALFLATCVLGYKAYSGNSGDTVLYSLMTMVGLGVTVAATMVAGIIQWIF